MAKQLAALVDEIPELEKRFSTMAGGIRTIFQDDQFNEWRANVLLLLPNLPDQEYARSIKYLLDSMNGHNDVATFSRVSGMLKAINEDSPMEQIFKLKKGIRVSTVFFDYTLTKQIGEGGNGTVWEAKKDDGEAVAIKLLKRDSKRKNKRFKNETIFCFKYSHKNIVPVTDYGIAGEYSFYVMPLYAETLRKRIDQGIDGNAAINIFIGIMSGLQFAHSNKVVHRDIKPENILFLKNSNDPVIADFGIAHFSEEQLATVIETKSSERMGNFQYAAPEQRKTGVEVGPTADLYAAALILNEMFTKEVPFAANYKKIGDVAPDYAYLNGIVESLYVQDPGKRLQSAEQVLRDLKISAEAFAQRQQKEALEMAVIEASPVPHYSVTVKSIKFSQGSLVFELDNDLPSNWQNYLTGGHHTISYYPGYSPRELKTTNTRMLKMPLDGIDNPDQIKAIAGMVKTWVGYISIDHLRSMEANAEAQRRKKEDERKREIDRLNREMKINNILADI